MADSELKVGMRGTFGDVRSEVVGVFSSLVIVRSLETGCEYGIGRELFTPDPDPPSTVKVEMDRELVEWWRNFPEMPVAPSGEGEMFQRTAVALRAEGLE